MLTRFRLPCRNDRGKTSGRALVAVIEPSTGQTQRRVAARGLQQRKAMRSTDPIRLVVSGTRCGPACGALDDDCSFRVAWSINPHMRIGAVDPLRAEREHRSLVGALRGLGAVVHDVPFVHGAFDSVFAKDNAVIVERRDGRIDALLARPKFSVRRREQRARTASLGALGVGVVDGLGAPLEGGDVVVLPHGRGAFLGYGFRSSAKSAAELEDFLDVEVTPVELVDPHLYHLDMVLGVLDDGTALVCEEALTAAARRAVMHHPSVRSVISVPRDEAMKFGVNLVQIGRSIVWGATAPVTERALRGRGFDVHRLSLEEFHLAGGSAACLVSRIHRLTGVRRSDVQAPPSAA